jgi:hypothetical protein
MTTTTIQIGGDTKAELDKRKVDPRQTYDSVIQGLLRAKTA